MLGNLTEVSELFTIVNSKKVSEPSETYKRLIVFIYRMKIPKADQSFPVLLKPKSVF
jgi:hypothetical protein